MNCIEGTGKGVSRRIIVRQKIPRPPNAFMVYANEHRKILAHLYPADSNKEISRRLGQTWKDLSLLEKTKYFHRAKDIDQEHKRKYPGYVYNPKDARMRKAIRSMLKDRSIGASPMLPRPGIRTAIDSEDFYRQNLVWNGLCNRILSQNASETCSTVTALEGVNLRETPSNVGVQYLNLIESNDEERAIYEKEKSSLEAAENYTKLVKHEDLMKTSYLPISTAKFIHDPELCTNNAEYHKEYIIKYFNQIPNYETYNVTTEDGVTFPYVTIPNLIVRQNVAGVSYH